MHHNQIVVLTRTGRKCGWTRPSADFKSVIQIENEYNMGGVMNYGKNALLFFQMMAGFRRARTVADPFLGTGPTLLACEQSGRRCVGVELDPGILAVAL